MAERRPKPFIHMKWLSPLLIGDKQCKWAVWYQTHFQYVKTVDDHAEVKHQIAHTQLREVVINQLRGRECWIDVEREIFIDGDRSNLSGKIDLLAYKGERGVIFEIKSGKPWPTDKAQLMLYMWALKRAYKKFQHILFDGIVVYPDRRVKVSAVEIDEDFCQAVEDYITDLLDNEPERKFPSKTNCRYCKVAECDERWAVGDGDEEPSDFIPAFL